METLVDEIEIAGRSIVVERPREPESLLDEEAFARDEFMPYWAELWPSGIALARHVAMLDVRGMSVLELGCGLGLPSLVAAISGAHVVATDWAPEALELLEQNAHRNGAALTTILADWRTPASLADRRFDLVLAADVVYEERNAAPLLSLLPQVVVPRGRVLVSDPGRRYAHLLLDGARDDGWMVETVADVLLPSGGIHRMWRA